MYIPISLQHRFLAVQTDNDRVHPDHQQSMTSTAEVAFHRPIYASVSLPKFKNTHTHQIFIKCITLGPSTTAFLKIHFCVQDVCYITVKLNE